MMVAGGKRIGVHVATLLLALMLVSCGGGREGGREITSESRFKAAVEASLQTTPASAPTDLRKTALAAVPSATFDPDALDVAEQLMDFAEAVYPAFFPGHPNTEYYGDGGYYFRYYAATGVHLGVRQGNVYLLGGPFGATVQLVGPLTQFITPAPVLRDPCLQPGAAYGVHATAAPALGKSAGAVIAGCTGPIRSPVWKQTAGPAVALLSERSQAISFDPTVAGTYRFEVSFIDTQNQSRTESVSITVPENPATALGVTVRVHQAVRTGGNVSLRAWPRLPEGEKLRSVSWRQLEGPAVTFDTDTEDDHLATFRAPAVTRDTLLRLRATVLTEGGLSVHDDVLVLVENYLQASATDVYAVWSGDHVQRVYPYRASGPYASELVRCAYDPILLGYGPGVNLCTLGRLPFLAQSGDMPTVDQVMDRVLVSHDWMGRNFETLLRTQDPNGDLRRMFRSVTAIIIGSQVRPSFYMPPIGAIYLDADTFWLTAEERDTVNEVPDYRSKFGKQLQYDDLWRYVKDGRNIFRFYDPHARVSRSMEDVQLEAAQLLFHELGHALDFLPPEDYPLLDTRLSAWTNMLPRYNRYRNTSDVVAQMFPLTASAMYGLAEVKYRGATPTDVQKGYTPEQVAAFFSADRATDPYAYSTDAEDTAMLIEEFLMQHRLGIPRDIAFAAPIGDDDTSATIIVRWGQRGRVGEPEVRVRAREVVRQLTPWVDPGEVDKLPAPQLLRAGASWRDNLSSPSAEPRRQPLSFTPSALERRQFRQELRRMRDHRTLGVPRAGALPPPLAPQLAPRSHGATGP